MPSRFGIVGRVLGPVSAVDPDDAGVGGGTLLSSGQGFDFGIADMGFRVFSTDKYPYQRETAQYRKEQFDSAQTPGEQSLEGWWLRAQFSNHRGAGIKYYEIEDTLLERYKTGLGLNPWEPGEVTLNDEFNNGFGTTVIDAVPGTLLGNTGVFALTSGGAVEFHTTSTNTPITEGGTATSITTNGSTLYATVGNTIKVQDGTTTLVTLWTHTDVGVTWQRVWWAKGRLFAVDSNDKWYALAKAGGSVAAAGAFWDPGTTPGNWVLTETPAFVLLGNGTEIYAITISTTGSVPSLAAPVVIGQVPVGETISTLHYYLGFVLIATQAGLRVGQADTSDGTPVMAYGPLTIEGDFSMCKRIAVFGSLAYAVGTVDGYPTSTLFAVNLSEMISDLLPAWTGHAELSAATAANQGATIDATGTIWAFVEGKTRFQDPTLEVSGSLTTGQLRFGTLEAKLIRSIKVRGKGDAGLIAISTVMPDDTENVIYTLDLSVQKDAEITLSLDGAIESIGFKFDLANDPGVASARPTLLGYQVRALPSPRRQRMIRVPLLIQDVEQNRRKVRRGHKGSGWQRLEALEDLESQQIMTQFSDFLTGESGVALIDSIRAEKTTPSMGASTGAGYIAYVELRKIG